MADPTYRELHGSGKMRRTSAGDEIELLYEVDTEDPEDTQFLWPSYGAAHPTYPALYALDISAEPRSGAPTCLVRVVYREPDQNTPVVDGREVWRWSIASQQVHVTSVKDTSYKTDYPTAANYGTAIGVKGDEVEGVDVLRTVTEITVNKLVSGITLDGIAIINGLQGKVNSNAWHGYDPGEVYFAGVVIETQPNGYIRLEYHFLVSPTSEPFTIVFADGSETVAYVLPWDYLWLVYGEKVQSVGGKLQKYKTIESAHISRVYDFGNLGLLGLTGPWT